MQLRAGDTLSLIGSFKQNGLIVDMTGFSLSATLTPLCGSGNPPINLSAVWIDAQTGACKISAPANATANWLAGSYSITAQVVSNSGQLVTSKSQAFKVFA